MRLPQDRILHIDIKYVENQVKVTAEWQGELVRCRDCKNRNENCGMGEHRWCETINMSTRADDYCSYGERREL